jgi:hypothetical protein
MIREITDAHIAAMPESSPMKAPCSPISRTAPARDFVDTYAQAADDGQPALVSAYAARLGDAMRQA